MILWFRYKHEIEVELHYFDLRSNPHNAQPTTIRVKNTGGEAYNINNF